LLRIIGKTQENANGATAIKQIEKNLKKRPEDTAKWARKRRDSKDGSKEKKAWRFSSEEKDHRIGEGKRKIEGGSLGILPLVETE